MAEVFVLSESVMLETLNANVLGSIPIFPPICFKAGEKKNEQLKTHQPSRVPLTQHATCGVL